MTTNDDWLLVGAMLILIAFVGIIIRDVQTQTSTSSKGSLENQVTQAQLSGTQFALETNKQEFERSIFKENIKYERDQESARLSTEVDHAVREHDLKELQMRQDCDLALRQHYLIELRAKHAIDMAVREQEFLVLETKHRHELALGGSVIRGSI